MREFWEKIDPAKTVLILYPFNKAVETQVKQQLGEKAARTTEFQTKGGTIHIVDHHSASKTRYANAVAVLAKAV